MASRTGPLYKAQERKALNAGFLNAQLLQFPEGCQGCPQMLQIGGFIN